MSPKTLKVSLVVGDLSASETRAYLLAEAIQRLGHRVEINGFLFGERLFVAPPPSIPIFYVKSKYYPSFLLSLIKLLRHIDADIIYAVKLKPTSFGIGVIKKFFAGKRLMLDMDDWVLSWYGGDEFRYKFNLKQFYRDAFKKDGALRYPDHPLYLKWMERLVSYADAITVDTNFLKDRFGGTYLPNGKDTLLFDPSKYKPEASRVKYGLSAYRILMFPGVPRPHKGVEDVLAALEQINEPDIRLVIVGDNPYDDYDKKLIQRWGRWIIKLPTYPIETMPEIISCAHIVVVPQRDDASARAQFPLKLTDGMAMAKPVLSTRVGDIPEILEDTGYIVEPNNPQQMAEMIKWIFAHTQEANEKSIRARNRCIKYYSVDIMAQIISEVLSRL